MYTVCWSPQTPPTGVGLWAEPSSRACRKKAHARLQSEHGRNGVATSRHSAQQAAVAARSSRPRPATASYSQLQPATASYSQLQRPTARFRLAPTACRASCISRSLRDPNRPPAQTTRTTAHCRRPSTATAAVHGQLQPATASYSSLQRPTAGYGRGQFTARVHLGRAPVCPRGSPPPSSRPPSDRNSTPPSRPAEKQQNS
jgi:hypothetical protein